MEALDHSMEARYHSMEARYHSMEALEALDPNMVVALDPNMVVALDPNMVVALDPLDPNTVVLDPNTVVALDPNMVDHNMVALVALKRADNMAANSTVGREANNTVDLVRSRRCQDSNRCNHHIPLNTLQSRLLVLYHKTLNKSVNICKYL